MPKHTTDTRFGRLAEFFSHLKTERGVSPLALLIGLAAAAAGTAGAIVLVATSSGTGTITGTFVDWAGTPIAGAQAAVRLPLDADPIDLAVTDGQGSFVFENVPAVSLVISAHALCPDGSPAYTVLEQVTLDADENLLLELVRPSAAPDWCDPAPGSAQATPTTLPALGDNVLGGDFENNGETDIPPDSVVLTLPSGQAQATTTTSVGSTGTLPSGQAQATSTTTASAPLTLGDGFYLVPTEILPGTWVMAGTGCGWVRIDGGGTEIDKGVTNITVNSGDHTIRLLGGCVWTFSD